MVKATYAKRKRELLIKLILQDNINEQDSITEQLVNEQTGYVAIAKDDMLHYHQQEAPLLHQPSNAFTSQKCSPSSFCEFVK